MAHHDSGEPPPEIEICRQALENVRGALGLNVNDHALEQLATHFALLMAWNRRMNLTSLRDVEEIAWRHFGESLLLSKVIQDVSTTPSALLVDVGSGAGFPGVPLKIAWSGIKLVMLEPNRKKATFLKEVARRCQLVDVEVQTRTLEEAASGDLAGKAAMITMRAVAVEDETVGALARMLKPAGLLALYLGERDVLKVRHLDRLKWDEPIPVPRSERRFILIGKNASQAG